MTPFIFTLAEGIVGGRSDRGLVGTVDVRIHGLRMLVLKIWIGIPELKDQLGTCGVLLVLCEI